MDLIDRRIIGELIGNCRVAYRQLGKKLELSPTSVQRRVTKLRESGIISRPYVFLSLAMLDAEWAFIEMWTDASEKDEAIIDQLGADPSVITVARIGPRRLLAGAWIRGSTGLYDIGKFFRRFPFVKDAEIQFMHPVTPSPLPSHERHVYLGRKVNFSNPQLTVLKHLIHDARKPATEIAAETSYSSRRVQQLIQELQTCGGLYFTCLLRFSAAGIIPFWIDIHFDEKKAAPHKVVKWVQEKVPKAYWNAFLFSNRPRVMHFCTTKDIQTVVEITNVVKDAPFAERVESVVMQPQNHFVGPGYIRLAEMLGMKVSNHGAEYYAEKK
jgi:DNA-binding Lrp family transcriptional regulator